MRHWLTFGVCVCSAACSSGTTERANATPFAVVPYEPFSQERVVAIALREWRLWGQPVDDDPPGTRPASSPGDKPERQEGLWQRVGEYWWGGLPRGSPEAGWTGRHDDTGVVFPPDRDAAFAWSAAFVSYIMRIAGAGAGFPYAADHASYINAIVSADRSSDATFIAHAERLEQYSPVPGDLVCMGRAEAAGLRFEDLPAGHFPGHCDIVVENTTPGTLTVIGGNVGDAVTMKHIPVTLDGRLSTAGGFVLDPRYPWLLVLRTGPPGSRPL